MEPINFKWSISNQVGFNIRVCESLHINVDRVPISGSLPESYLLTIFPIDDGKDPKSVVIASDSEGNRANWVVDEPIGSKVVLSLKDTNGAHGGYSPHVFEVVAGRTTECVHPTLSLVHSDFSFQTDISEQSDDSKTLRIDVHGGVPPYETAFIWLTPSGAQAVSPIPFDQSPLTHSITAIRNDSLLTAVSDSKGKWAWGPSILRFASPVASRPQISQKQTHLASISFGLQTFSHQDVLSRRSSDDGTFIIVVDIVALAMLIIVTVGIILCDVMRRRKRRKLAQLKETITLQGTTVSRDLEAARTTTMNDASTDGAISNLQMRSVESNSNPSSAGIEKTFPRVPPPTPATRSLNSRQNSRQSESSSLQLQHRSLAERLTTLNDPTSYGDPYSRPRSDTHRSDVQSDLSHKTSSSSNKTAKLIAKLHAPYFSSFYEATLSDTRSGVLSRNLSKSSAYTMRTDQQMTPIPPSAGSTRPSWYQISSDAPDMPPLSSKEQESQ